MRQVAMQFGLKMLSATLFALGVRMPCLCYLRGQAMQLQVFANIALHLFISHCLFPKRTVQISLVRCVCPDANSIADDACIKGSFVCLHI